MKDKEKLNNPLNGWQIPSVISSMVFHTVQCGKLSPKESVDGGDTALRCSVRAPQGFSEGKPDAAKPRVRNPKGFAVKGLPEVIVIPRCLKDFQQLIRLPNSWGLLVNEASLNTVL